MSGHVLGWAAKASAGDPTAKAVLMVLAEAADTAGIVFLGQDTIAERCDTRRETVNRAIKRLEERGLLSRKRRNRADGSRTSDLIHLSLCDDMQRDEIAHREGAYVTISQGQCDLNAQQEPPVNPQIKDISSEHLPEGPKPTKTKTDYPVEFESLWVTYPHVQGRSSKKAAHAQWVKLAAADRSDFVLAVGAFPASPQAKRDGGQFVPAMERWVAKGQWRDFVPTATPEPAEPKTAEMGEWAEAMKLWAIGKWNSTAWGPRPGEPDCRVPVDVLARHGLVDNVTPFPAHRGGAA